MAEDICIVQPPFSKGHSIIKNHLSQWDFSRDLSGMVLKSLDELVNYFPQDGGFSLVYLRLSQKGLDGIFGFDRYARKSLGGHLVVDVAYGCYGCSNIIIGPPQITLLASGKGLDYFCLACDGHLYTARWHSLAS